MRRWFVYTDCYYKLKHKHPPLFQVAKSLARPDLDKYWKDNYKRYGGGGGGKFGAAGRFFRYQIPCMNFFKAIALTFFRINWRA